MLYRKQGRKYVEVTPSEVVLDAIRILNSSPGGKEVVDFITLKTLQGKLTIKDEVLFWKASDTHE